MEKLNSHLHKPEVETLHKYYHGNGTIAAFIGAGCSSPLKIPMWTEMLIALNDEFGYYKNKEEVQADISDIGFARVASNIKSKATSDNVYTRILQQYSRPVVCNYTSLHIEIIRLSKLIVTTNYDNSFEQTFLALQRIVSGEEYKYTKSSLGGFNYLGWGEKNNILHLHGDVETGNLILTNESYLEQYDTPESGVASLIRNIFDGITTVFIGFSFEDETFITFLKKAIQQIKIEKARYSQPAVKHYCIMSSNLSKDYLTISDLIEMGASTDELLKLNILIELSEENLTGKKFEFQVEASKKIEDSQINDVVKHSLIWLLRRIDKNKEKLEILKDLDLAIISYTDGKYLEIEEILRSITEKPLASALSYKP